MDMSCYISKLQSHTSFTGILGNCKVGGGNPPKMMGQFRLCSEFLDQIHPDCMKNGRWTRLISLSTNMLNIHEPVE